ncbi:MAG: type 1 glutamine amidotransferase [Candidatus Omnitrophica bacterium]|nr:type 1 glutamine amidotransferase [Candidatus Omnitrophota bacterium]MDD5574223.1 type 1 glutamine amidotransferase [Candidatus Omnitrophota bacterium]
MKRIAVLVEDMYQELEVWYPYLRLKEEGCDVLAVGTDRSKSYKSKLGYEIPQELGVKDAAQKDFDAVIIPGGYAPDILRRYPEVNSFVRTMFARGKVVASICHGGWVLASAGILKGRTVTSFFAIKDDMVNAGAEFVDQEVVVDGNLITSRKPEDLPAFMKAVLKALK